MTNKCKLTKAEIKSLDNVIALANELADDRESLKDVKVADKILAKLKKCK